MIVNLVNGKFYIGSAINLKNREWNHFSNLNKNKHKNKYLQNAYNKYGRKNFKFIILEYIIDKTKLIIREQWWLDLFYDNQNMCYNISPTAYNCLGVKHTEEFKKKKSENAKQQWENEDTRKTLLEARKGRISPMKGKRHSEETKQIIKQKRKIQIITKESIEKRKQTLLLKYGGSPNKGKKQTEEHRLKNAIGHGAKPFLVYKEGFFVGKWLIQADCARELGVNRKHINSCLKGKRKSTGGYTFKYAS